MAGIFARIFGAPIVSRSLLDGVDDESFHGLNIKQAIDAHVAWRERMEAILDGSEAEVPPVSHIAQDNLCPLGKWLYGPASHLFGRMAEYRELMTHHEKFHVCAGEILIEHKLGNVTTAGDKLRRQFMPLTEKLHAGIINLHVAARK